MCLPQLHQASLCSTLHVVPPLVHPLQTLLPLHHLLLLQLRLPPLVPLLPCSGSWPGGGSKLDQSRGQAAHHRLILQSASSDTGWSGVPGHIAE